MSDTDTRDQRIERLVRERGYGSVAEAFAAKVKGGYKLDGEFEGVGIRGHITTDSGAESGLAVVSIIDEGGRGWRMTERFTRQQCVAFASELLKVSLVLELWESETLKLAIEQLLDEPAEDAP